MAKAVALFTGGITERREAAIRTDGTVFTRSQVKDPRYGYRWSRWRALRVVLDETARETQDTLEVGLVTLRRSWARADANGRPRVRLPGLAMVPTPSLIKRGARVEIRKAPLAGQGTVVNVYDHWHTGTRLDVNWDDGGATCNMPAAIVLVLAS